MDLHVDLADTVAPDTAFAAVGALAHPPARVRTAGRRTVAAAVRVSGVGLHSGQPASVVIHPAPAGTGILFRRTDLATPAEIPARWDLVRPTPLCTTLVNADSVSLATIEHLMAALVGCGIDDATIDVDGPELPIMDGSSGPFVFLLDCVGTAVQPLTRRAIRLLQTVRVEDGDKFAALEPDHGFAIDVEIVFEAAAIGRQRFVSDTPVAAFREDLARARTFGLLHEVEYLRGKGLIKGGSLDNAVVVGDEGVVNAEGLRFVDEFVRHKALDALGDLALAGAPIRGRYVASRASHALNNALLRALFAQPSAWRWERA